MSEAPPSAFEFGLYCCHYADAIKCLFDRRNEKKDLATAQAQDVAENLMKASDYFMNTSSDPGIQKCDYERFFEPSSGMDEPVVNFFRTLSYAGITAGADAEVEDQENAQEFAKVAMSTRSALKNAGVTDVIQRINHWINLRRGLVAVLRATAISKGEHLHRLDIEDSDILNIPRYFVDASAPPASEATGVQSSFVGTSAQSRLSGVSITFTLTVPPGSSPDLSDTCNLHVSELGATFHSKGKGTITRNSSFTWDKRSSLRQKSPGLVDNLLAPPAWRPR